MHIYLNEKEYEVAEGTVLSALPALCGLPDKGIAFAIDNYIIAKTDWKNTLLSNGCKIMAIKAVAGG
jgi:thiamine biosynthesis protein ThiS